MRPVLVGMLNGLFIIPVVTVCAEELPERNATAQEIQGNWELISLPSELEPKFFKANPWPAECQWYSYSASGVLKSFDRSHGPCESLSSAQVDDIVKDIPAVAAWKYDLSPVYNKGVLLVTRSDVKGYMEIWEPHIVAHSFSKGGEDFREGDLLLYLANMGARQLVWIRHLRKLQ